MTSQLCDLAIEAEISAALRCLPACLCLPFACKTAGCLDRHAQRLSSSPSPTRCAAATKVRFVRSCLLVALVLPLLLPRRLGDPVGLAALTSEVQFPLAPAAWLALHHPDRPHSYAARRPAANLVLRSPSPRLGLLNALRAPHHCSDRRSSRRTRPLHPALLLAAAEPPTAQCRSHTNDPQRPATACSRSPRPSVP